MKKFHKNVNSYSFTTFALADCNICERGKSRKTLRLKSTTSIFAIRDISMAVTSEMLFALLKRFDLNSSSYCFSIIVSIVEVKSKQKTFHRKHFKRSIKLADQVCANLPMTQLQAESKLIDSSEAN